MDEARLIEISQRFRAMEDIAERADLLLSAYQNPGEMSPDEHVPLEEFLEVRLKLGNTMESCREDLVFMQEQLRKAAK